MKQLHLSKRRCRTANLTPPPGIHMTNASDAKYVLVVDDHPLIADATRALLMQLDTSLQITICHTADTALIEFNKRSDWHRIFLDVTMPGTHGLFLPRQFAKLGVAGKCTIITASDNPQWPVEAEAMGMLGYIAKATHIKEFTGALRAVLNGQPTFPATTPTLGSPHAIRLTRRQEEVLQLLHRGLTSPDIAAHLGITPGTVDNHVTALMSAFNVKNRTQIVVKGIELGHIDLKTTLE